ncbi:restriction endonuclease subunit S [Anaerolineales bacterium HSG24]|nr:restriction endonuclease subunit S [Anaerolineales bacterium HSG24]
MNNTQTPSHHEERFTIKPYPAYKDLGVVWLGEIPAHWEVRRLKYTSKIFRGKFTHRPRNDMRLYDGNYPFFQTGDVANSNKYLFDNKQTLNEKGLRVSTLIPKGTVVITIAANIGDIAILQVDACFPDSIVGFEPSDLIDRDFLYYFLSIMRQQFIGSTIKNTQMNLNIDRIGNNSISIPPLAEQTAIANFLDEKTAKIDTAIAQKEQLITLLKERKQIIIQAMVSGQWLVVNDEHGQPAIAKQNGKGQFMLNGSPLSIKTKDSGIEWIGEIPEGWDVKRAKYLFNEVNDRSRMGTEELLSVSHMTGVTPRSEKTITMFMAEDYTGSKVCQNGDLVINIMWAWMGALGISDRTGIVSPSYDVFRQKYANTFNLIFLEHLMKTTKYIEHYNKVSTGLHSSRLRFYGHMFFNMALTFPSIEEQQAIVAHIETQSAKIEQAISLQQQQIAKLKEYKTVLINSAVTGKIMVNG